MDRTRVDEGPTPEDDGTPQAYRVPDPSPPPWQPVRAKEKNVVLAVILAALIPGLGHVYGRRAAQGGAIFIVVAVLLLLYFMIFTIFIAAAVWIWQVYDAYRTVSEYNRSVRESGARPW